MHLLISWLYADSKWGYTISIKDCAKGGCNMGLRVEKVEKMRGGDGHVIIAHVLEKEQLGEHAKMYAQVTLEPGCGIGYHEHHGESEIYYILSGEGCYDDNGEKRCVKAGDVTVTPDGRGHALTNTGTENLVLMALILLD